MEGHAESIESLACHGRIHRALHLLNSDWRMARSLKMPCVAQDTSSHRSTSTGSSRLRRWTDKPLTITVAADAAEDERTSRLLNLAGYDELDVVTAQVRAPSKYVHVPLVRYERIHRDGIAILTHSQQPGARYGDIFDFLPAAIDDIGEPHARTVALAWFAHCRLERDLLVTTNKFLLEQRETRAWLDGQGITAPEEATQLAEAFLRYHGHFNVYASEDGMHSVSTGLFYNAVARAALPRAVEAMRSCLAPPNRARHRNSANHLESIIHRFHDLGIAQDRLAALAQEEGFLGGGNDLLAEQLYHFQNSIVLLTGALDVLAWIVADLDAVTPPPASVSWSHLVRVDRPWVRKLSHPTAKVLANAAQGRSRGAPDVTHLRAAPCLSAPTTT